MKISFIGGGNMAQSLIGGLLHNNKICEISVCDINQDTLNSLEKQFSVTVFLDAKQAIKNATVIIFAIKPQFFKTVAQSIKDVLPPESLLISIAAGVQISSIKQWLNTDLPIIRTMPNTPALVATGMTGIFSNTKLSLVKKQIITDIFLTIGQIIWLKKESELDAVTAISGSGPAYFFLLFEAVESLAIELGLDQKTVQLLIQQTALGAATMALKSNNSSQKLKEMVSSKGGTTEKALGVLADNHWGDTLKLAIKSAYHRSIEMKTMDK